MSLMSATRKQKRDPPHRATRGTTPAGTSSSPSTPPRLSAAVVVEAIGRGDVDDDIDDVATAVNARIRTLNQEYEAAVSRRLRVGAHVRLNHNLEPQDLHGQPCTVVARDGDRWVLRLHNPIGKFADKDLRVSATQIAMPEGPE
jgi:hypothetical protein